MLGETGGICDLLLKHLKIFEKRVSVYKQLYFFFLILFIKQKYVTILTIVHLDKCSCIGH